MVAGVVAAVHPHVSVGVRGASSALLDGSTPNYAMWVAAGDEHCVIPYDRFWWRRAADGTALSAWLQRMVDGEAVASVDCGGEACLVGVEQ